LDELERAGDRTRRELGVSTLSISRFAPHIRALSTLCNTGTLGPGEQRRPTVEQYPLSEFPAARALVTYRRPYISTPGLSGDLASVALEAALDKSSQAAAPLIIDDGVWGEVWVASTASELPLARRELPLICWAADQLAATLAQIIGDLAPAFADEPAPLGQRSYEVWIDGPFDREVLLAAIGVPGRRVGDYTLLTGAFVPAELCALLARLVMGGVDILAVTGDPRIPAAPAQGARTGRSFEIVFLGRIDPEHFTDTFQVSVSYDGDYTRTSGRLDRAALAGLLHHAGSIDAELIALISGP
jgi:hypothetical protein